MGFLDELGKAVKSLGDTFSAGPGLVYDVATTAMPGDQWGAADDDGWGIGNVLDAAGHRFYQATGAVRAAGHVGLAGLEGAGWAYHTVVDRPLSTVALMASHLDAGSDQTHYGDLFSGEAWSKAYEIADQQSLGKSAMDAFTSSTDPFKRYRKEQVQVMGEDGKLHDQTNTITPFQNNEFTQNHGFLANAGAFAIDFKTAWSHDPLVYAGKIAGTARQTYVLAKIPTVERGTMYGRLDGSVGAIEGGTFARMLKPDYEARADNFFNFISGENKLNRPLLAAEIRAISPELSTSSGGQAISAALARAAKIEDPVERGNAMRRIVAVGAGDTTQIERLAAENADAKSIADSLRNVNKGSTVELKAQALNEELATNPKFRQAMQAQLDNLSAEDNLGQMLTDWHRAVTDELKVGRTLSRAEGQLDFLPGVHRGPTGTAAKLAKTQGAGKLDRIEAGHDKVVSAVTERMTRFPGNDTRATVLQRGLHNVPIIAAYPVKWTASLLPTKFAPAFVRNLSRTHYIGVANVHDWDGSVDQLNSMMHLAGVENQTRIGLLSDAAKMSSEADKVQLIMRVEAASERAAVARAAAKHGINVDDEFLSAVRDYAQSRRGNAISAMNGGRQYSATSMSGDMAFRARTTMKARQEAALDNKIADESTKRLMLDEVDESADMMQLRMDHWIDESGMPVSLPLVSSQLTNRVPLLDVHMLNQSLDDVARVKRLETMGDAYRRLALDAKGMERQLLNAKGTAAARLQKQVINARKGMDALLSAASFTNRWWKMSVLFRLGYPMRVLADDHMRIAAQLGYPSFLRANLPEARSNLFYNHMPTVLAKAMRGTTRKMQAKARMVDDQARRQFIRDHTGWKQVPTKDQWKAVESDIKVYLGKKGSPEDKAAAYERILAHDPDGRAIEYHDLKRQVKQAESGIRSLQRSIEKMREEGADAAAIAEKEAKIAHWEGSREHALDQLAGALNPRDLRSEMEAVETRLVQGWTAYRDPKRMIGEADVTLPNGQKVGGSLDSSHAAYREASSSSHAFDYQITDGEEMGYALNSAGHWRTVAPTERGYYQLWANILNHQIKHSPEFMAILRTEESQRTPQQFAKWLSQPENQHITERVGHYAHDPEDWGGRLIAMAADYIPSRALENILRDGQVSARQLERMFPQGDARLPFIHGSLADVNSGRAGAARMFSSGIQNVFRYLSEVPTDRLSRHPFFNAVYQREVKQAAEVKLAAKGKDAKFNETELAEIERIGREKALKELKRTLWDVSAHSHAAHTMRFLSPFFAAHQESLSRWWNIVKDKPQTLRYFQMAFDAPRRAGLVVDEDGNPVKPGEAIGPGHSIVIKVPWADGDNAVNKWLLKHGGGKYWEVGENGFNLVLQNGIANPGIGPMVSAPLESLVQHYADEHELEKAARVLNSYPPVGDNARDITMGAFAPSWSKRVVSLMKGEKSQEFGRYYMQNFTDSLAAWNETHSRPPTRTELVELEKQANAETHRDMLLMLGSNLTWFTPAKPNSEYEGIRNGLRRLYEQMRTEGHDMDWLRDTFKNMYGEPYMAFIYSMGTNPGDLDGTPAEVRSMRKHKGLLKDINDPTLARMVIGMDATTGSKDDQTRSDAAASWQVAQGFRGSKDPRDVAESIVVAQGWRQYEELTNYLQVQADQMGLASYEDSKELVEAKRRGLAAIKAQNPVFRDRYDSWSRESYDAKVDLMRMIASDKGLRNDPFRQDVYWLGQYIQVRDLISQELKARAAEGGSSTIGAKDNADLAQKFAAAVTYMNSQSDAFRQYHYEGIIERDPFLLGEDVSGDAEAR